MDVPTPTGAIVVGVDASEDSDRAVIWALGMAEPSGTPVHFVHVQTSAPSYLLDETGRQKWERAGQAILDAAIEQAEQVPTVPVSRQTIFEPGVATADGLVSASRDASMVVVGTRGHGGFAGLLVGSVSQHVARHADCPVAAVRAQADPHANRVVVGVDDSEGAQEALALAFEIAAQHGVGLTAVHAFHAPSLYGRGVVLPMPGDVGEHLASEQQELARVLAPWEQKYPGVPVTPEVIPGHPAEVLTHASGRAALVVVGSRGRGAFTGLLLGSVGQQLLHLAQCPVLIAR